MPRGPPADGDRRRAARRARSRWRAAPIGWPLPLLALLTLLYGLFGQYVPGEFGHPGTPLASFLGTLTIAEGGLWGSLTGVSVGHRRDLRDLRRRAQRGRGRRRVS